MEAEQGSDISIVAKIRGCPFPTLTWYKAPPHKSDDKVEVQYDEHINKIVSDDSCTLLIEQGKRPDTGLYTLVASNSIGKASKEMRLNVLGMNEQTRQTLNLKNISSSTDLFIWKQKLLSPLSYEIQRTFSFSQLIFKPKFHVLFNSTFSRIYIFMIVDRHGLVKAVDP